ncbi:MAG: hypothetical protein WB760_12865 [Xanthobacteraceae bacterium]
MFDADGVRLSQHCEALMFPGNGVLPSTHHARTRFAVTHSIQGVPHFSQVSAERNLREQPMREEMLTKGQFDDIGPAVAAAETPRDDVVFLGITSKVAAHSAGHEGVVPASVFAHDQQTNTWPLFWIRDNRL